MTDFYVERSVMATRKLHKCRECMTYIQVGEPAVVSTGRDDGFFTYYSHPECSAAGKANAERSGNWGEEYAFCVDLADYSSDLEWLEKHHPVVLQRLRVAGVGLLRPPSDPLRLHYDSPGDLWQMLP